MKRASHIHKIRAVTVVGPHALQLTFEDGKTSIVDLEGLLFGEIYEPLKDPSVFRQVQLDPEVPTIVWPNGADFDPETLYNWEQHVSAWRAAAARHAASC